MKSFDETIDAAFEPLRGRPKVDRAAAVVSNMADYGIIWVVLALFKARRRGPARRRAVLSLGAAGVSSMMVNRAAKSVVERERPEEHLDAPVRAPSSSSFPSGHTLAAFCTAFVLTESSPGTATAVGFAGAVAVSRVHLRAHHPSDVVGGAAIGSVLGLGLRPLVNLVTPGAKGRAKGAKTNRRRDLGQRADRGAAGMGPQGILLKRL